MPDETQITGQTKRLDQFRILESDHYNPAHLTRVLDGEILGFKVQNFVSDQDCNTIYQNFTDFEDRYERGADAPAIYAGTYHYGKTLDQYFSESEKANEKIQTLFQNATNAISAALQFPSEHKWLAPQHQEEARGDYRLRVSHGRFFLVPAPTSALGWPLWMIKMIPMLFARFFVCVSILPAHDYHHRNAGCKTWPMEPWLRQTEIDNGARYTDYYGLREPTNAQFKIWAQTPPDAIASSFSFLSLVLPQLPRKQAEGCSDFDVPT